MRETRNPCQPGVAITRKVRRTGEIRAACRQTPHRHQRNNYLKIKKLDIKTIKFSRRFCHRDPAHSTKPWFPMPAQSEQLNVNFLACDLRSLPTALLSLASQPLVSPRPRGTQPQRIEKSKTNSKSRANGDHSGSAKDLRQSPGQRHVYTGSCDRGSSPQTLQTCQLK